MAIDSMAIVVYTKTKKRIMANRNMALLTIVMAVVYIAIGCVFCFTRLFSHNIADNRIVIGMVFLVYGSFRLINGYRKWKKSQSENE